MPAGTGSVCKRITIEPAPAAPAAETPMPRPTARTDRKSLTQPQLAQRRETKPSAGSVVATCEPKAPGTWGFSFAFVPWRLLAQQKDAERAGVSFDVPRSGWHGPWRIRSQPKGGFGDDRNGYWLSGPAVRFDEADRVWVSDRAEVAACRAPG